MCLRTIKVPGRTITALRYNAQPIKERLKSVFATEYRSEKYGAVIVSLQEISSSSQTVK